jgi:hypothetical protein
MTKTPSDGADVPNAQDSIAMHGHTNFVDQFTRQRYGWRIVGGQKKK